MPFNRLLPLIACLLLSECYDKKIKQVLVVDFESFQGEYSDVPIEKLNGKVKEIYTGHSLLKNNYSKIYIGHNGNMASCVKRILNVVISKSVVDSTTELRRFNYAYLDKDDHSFSITERDSNGQEFELDFNASGQIENRNCKYDKHGNLVEFKYDIKKNVEPDIFSYIYNKQGLVVEDELFEGALLLKRTHRYIAFDANNNWTTKIVRKERYIPSGMPPVTDTIVRKITYY